MHSFPLRAGLSFPRKAKCRTSTKASFPFGVGALYVRVEGCQYKCQNVLAFARIIRYRLEIWKNRSRNWVLKNWLDNNYCGCYIPKHWVAESFRYAWGGGPLRGSLQLTISRSSCPAFSVSSRPGKAFAEVCAHRNNPSRRMPGANSGLRPLRILRSKQWLKDITVPGLFPRGG